MKKNVPLNDQPLSSFPWICFNVGFNSLEEVAERYHISLEELEKEVKATENTRARKKVITGAVQKLNRRPIVYQGKEYTLKEFAELLKLPFSTVQARHKRGMTPEEIAALPYRGRATTEIYRVAGKSYVGVGELARAYNQNPATVQTRLNKGWTPEQAVYTPIQRSTRKKSFLCLGKWYNNLYEVANEYNIPYQTLHSRRKKCPNKRLDDIVLSICDKPAYQYVVDGVGYSTLREISESYSITYSKLVGRIHSGKYNTMEDLLKDRKEPVYVINGKGFDSMKEIEAFYGVKKISYLLQKAKLPNTSKNVEKVVLSALKGEDKARYVYLGKKYCSMKELCKDLGYDERSFSYYFYRNEKNIAKTVEAIENPQRRCAGNTRRTK